MTRSWWVVLFLGLLTMTFKATGPMLLGGRRRELPISLTSALARLPAALFSALLVTQVFSDGKSIVFDARVAGLLTAIVSAACRAPRLVTLFGAVMITALLRHTSL